MLGFVRAWITAALIALFVNVGSGPPAGDARSGSNPQPQVHGYTVPGSTATVRATARSQPPTHGRTTPGSTTTFTATAYCQRGMTRSGAGTHAGIAAADPHQLPVGSVVQIDADMQKYTGVYTVLDTGSKVQGHHVDLFMHDCSEAAHFGRQPVRVTVLRKGWSPKASAPKHVLAASVGR